MATTTSQSGVLNESGHTSAQDAQADEIQRTDSRDLSKDERFQLVQNWRRREILRYLADNDGQADVGELAEHIAATKEGVAIGAVTSKQRKSSYVGLYQCHLPQLADADVIEYDKNRGTVEACDRADTLVRYLEEDEEPATMSRRLSIGVVGAVIAVTLLATAMITANHTTTQLLLIAWSSLSTAGFVLVATHRLLNT